ncbi:hypothetical protein [Microbacterium sp. VKM Ac-2923]|uniref:COG1470 family protein n=1 Tax=Microbacterium sp. VKM Ac-2923 TaxID=2929476 RepID=UPI001FB32578|nr:hypothetical protein [Microbacterium sp. VKM Ac-2923]MCJ1708826.1 hypothetical protein [Microbacterium sp. VKM Ac-2923]
MLPRLLFRAAAIVLGTTVLTLSSVIAATPAQAGESADAGDTVTWSVEPADASGPTGEPWTELTLDAGQSVTEHMSITNRGLVDVVFQLSAEDGYFTDTGRFNMLRADEASVDAGTWISIADSVEVRAGDSVILPFRVDVPADATPGDHPAGVAASIRTGDSTIGVESRVGFRVMTRVRGDLAPALSVTDQTAIYTPSWTPFRPGSLTVTSTIVNSGNTRLGALPRVTTAGPLGVFAIDTTPAQIPEFAPGESRVIATVVPEVWPTFVTQVGTTAEAVAVVGAEPLPEVAATAQSTVATIPWSHLLLLAMLALAFALLRWRGTARRRDVARMLDDAREEGRRQGASMNAGLAVVLIAAIAGVVGVSEASPSFAAAGPSTVFVDVDVTPRPSLPTSTPGIATPTPTPSPGGLARTGLAVDGWGVLAAGIVVTAGVAAMRVAARRRSASDPRC